MNFEPWKRTIPRLLQPYPKKRLQLGASESIKLSIMLIVQ